MSLMAISTRAFSISGRGHPMDFGSTRPTLLTIKTFAWASSTQPTDLVIETFLEGEDSDRLNTANDGYTPFTVLLHQSAS